MSQSHTHTIALVEDDEAIHDFLLFYFAAEEVSSLQAWDGDEAIALIDKCIAENALPCLILLDCNLPRSAGSIVIQYIRSAGIQVPIVAMSANRVDLADAVKAGANLTIRKPFDIGDLTNVLLTHCAFQRSAQQAYSTP